MNFPRLARFVRRIGGNASEWGERVQIFGEWVERWCDRLACRLGGKPKYWTDSDLSKEALRIVRNNDKFIKSISSGYRPHIVPVRLPENYK